MVLEYNFQDIFDISSKITTFNLPTYKQNCLKIQFKNAVEIETVYSGTSTVLPFASSTVFEASISSWRRLTAVNTACKAVYEATFDVKNSKYTFKAGDTIGIIPKNNAEEVDFIIDYLNVASHVDSQYTLTIDSKQKGAKIPLHIPIKSTLRHVLTHCVDIRSVLKKLFILTLSHYTKDEQEKRVLQYLSSKEGSAAYNTHILNKRLCILDLLTIFKSCKPPIEVLLANLQRLMPRPYSIVNSGLRDSNILKICFSVTDVGIRKGLTTGWLEDMILNQDLSIENKLLNLSLNERGFGKVSIYLRKNMSKFSLPDSLDISVVMIGIGTGVSPFIGFLEEREFHKKKDPAIVLGDAWLFFGCRNPKLDFIYEEEINDFLSNGILTKLSTAFSRDDSSEFKYIQDALISNGEDLTKVIEDGATIYVCGDINTIAAQIREVIVKCIEQHTDKCKEEAELYVTDMQKSQRYIVDVWS